MGVNQISSILQGVNDYYPFFVLVVLICLFSVISCVNDCIVFCWRTHTAPIGVFGHHGWMLYGNHQGTFFCPNLVWYTSQN
jgi:hypothetical protein